MHRPAELRRNDVAVIKRHVFTFSQRLDAVHLRVFNVDIFRIPQRGAAFLRHFASGNRQPVVMPERIAQIEETALDFDVRAFLEGAFAVRRPVETAVGRFHAMAFIQRPFFIIRLIFNSRLQGRLLCI